MFNCKGASIRRLSPRANAAKGANGDIASLRFRIRHHLKIVPSARPRIIKESVVGASRRVLRGELRGVVSYVLPIMVICVLGLPFHRVLYDRQRASQHVNRLFNSPRLSVPKRLLTLVFVNFRLNSSVFGDGAREGSFFEVVVARANVSRRTSQDVVTSAQVWGLRQDPTAPTLKGIVQRRAIRASILYHGVSHQGAFFQRSPCLSLARRQNSRAPDSFFFVHLNGGDTPSVSVQCVIRMVRVGRLIRLNSRWDQIVGGRKEVPFSRERHVTSRHVNSYQEEVTGGDVSNITNLHSGDPWRRKGRRCG